MLALGMLAVGVVEPNQLALSLSLCLSVCLSRTNRDELEEEERGESVKWMGEKLESRSSALQMG